MAKAPRYDSFKPASEKASRAKRRNRGKDTRPELLLRRVLWARGLRYRLHRERLPGRPDLVFPTARVAVFVDGDFWHGRNWPELRRKLQNRASADYWLRKIAYNRDRDQRINLELEALGWRVLRFWETELLKDVESAATVVFLLVKAPAGGDKP